MRTLRLSSCIVDLATGNVVHLDGRTVSLTPRELELLRHLVEHAGRAVARDELLEQIWQLPATSPSRAVDTTVRRLRQKLEAGSGPPRHILTAPGGYRLEPGDPPPEAPSTDDDVPFVGRSAELTELQRGLEAPGWWTLVGPPGAGKTRLARELVRRSPGLAGGARFCDLTDTVDLPGVLRAITGALGLPLRLEGAAEADLPLVVRALASHGPLLLVLDNAEHVLAAARQVCVAARGGCPEARVVVTSRQALGHLDERLVVVDPPRLDEAVALFRAYAARARPGFTVHVDERSQVEALVEQLDRLPLALALAAGRLSAMSVGALLQRIDHRFRLLRDPRRDAPDRQRTLRAALDGSWEALDAVQQRALATCAVFRGGFTGDAAAAVLDVPDPEAVLEALRTRSLLTLRDGRYSGLVSVRAYAAERLAEDRELEEHAIARHGETYAALAEAADEALRVELHNLELATDRALSRGRGRVALRAGFGLLEVLQLTAPMRTVAERCEALLTVPEATARERVVLHTRAAMAHQRTGARASGERHIAAALEVADRSGDPVVRSVALRARGDQRRLLGDLDGSLADLRAAVSLGAEAPSPRAVALGSLGLTLQRRGDLDGARRAFEELLALRETAQDEFVDNALGNLALLERRAGNVDRSQDLYEQALERFRRRGDRRAIIGALHGLGGLAHERGDQRSARAHYEASRPLVRALGEDFAMAGLEGNLGEVCRAEGDLVAARAHAQRALDHVVHVGRPRFHAIALGNLGDLDLQLGHLERAEASLREACTRLEALGDRLSLAELLEPFTRVALARGDLEAARSRAEALDRAAAESRSPLRMAAALAVRAELCLAEGTDPGPTLDELEARIAGFDAQAPIRSLLADLRARARAR